jgi:hypothetical protein
VPKESFHPRSPTCPTPPSHTLPGDTLLKGFYGLPWSPGGEARPRQMRQEGGPGTEAGPSSKPAAKVLVSLPNGWDGWTGPAAETQLFTQACEPLVTPGRSPALVRDQGVAGSNPVSPTIRRARNPRRNPRVRALRLSGARRQAAGGLFSADTGTLGSDECSCGTPPPVIGPRTRAARPACSGMRQSGALPPRPP